MGICASAEIACRRGSTSMTGFNGFYHRGDGYRSFDQLCSPKEGTSSDSKDPDQTSQSFSDVEAVKGSDVLFLVCLSFSNPTVCRCLAP